MQYVWGFDEAGADPELIGDRGRSLTEMRALGLPVPPGCSISALACRRFLQSGDLPGDSWDQVVAYLERFTAAEARPPLLAVRSSPSVPMPGVMGTVLYVGVTEDSYQGLVEWGSEEFAADVRRRFLQGFAGTVRRVPRHRIESVMAEVCQTRGSEDAAGLDVAGLTAAGDAMAALIVEESQRPVPVTLEEQAREAVEAVFESWDRRPARRHRRRRGIVDDLGTAAVTHLMVFGNAPGGSGTGIAFSRDPVDGHPMPGGIYIDGASRPKSQLLYPGIADLDAADHTSYGNLTTALTALETARREVVRVEFVRERGELWLVEARRAEQAPQGAVRSAVDMVDEGLLTKAEAMLRINPEQLDGMLHPHLAPHHLPAPLATGAAASPGAAAGGLVFDAAAAVDAAAAGRPVILVTREALPEDVAGVRVAAGLLATHGGGTSHGVVVARGIGTPAVAGIGNATIDLERREMSIAGHTFGAGDTITIDGSTGNVYPGSLEIEPPVRSPALGRLLEWADDVRRLEVWANADTPEDAAAARTAGAEGIGLARTEYMFAGDRLAVVQQILLGADPGERTAALAALEELQIGDFERLLEAMDGMPVVVRLLDPPLHEFLPDRLDVEHDLQLRRGQGLPTEDLERLEASLGWHEESNPMLGLRGVRLAVVIPEIYRVQVLAALEAVRRRLDAGGDPRLELMIPLVGLPEELFLVRDMIEEEVHYAGRLLELAIGTMIELPRTALVAGDIALGSDFFSFGTNDLTQTTLGLSRDDAEEAFLREYLEQGILVSNPFRTIDPDGVGRLIEIAIEEGLRINPGLDIGVCGEHGGDPASIEFFHRVGVDYVSCSPPRVPIARLAAAQAALRHPPPVVADPTE